MQFLGLGCACAHEDGVEAAVEHLVDGQVLTDGRVAAEDHSEFLDFADFAAHHLFRQSIFRNAEHQHASRFRLHLEDLHREAFSRKVAGDGKSGRSAANHRHASTRLLRQPLADELHVAVEVGNEAFQFAYSHRAFLLSEHAMPLALTLVRAYASAHGRQVALAVDYVHGVSEIAHRQFVNPVGNVLTDRAALAALRCLAVKASLCLVDSLEHSETFVGFRETLFCFSRLFHIYI